ncbi:M23 family metallopeptidase, partial [bacterium]|nr:M23 family metallopeptidase [bacterium]
VSTGQSVSSGTSIGAVGCTGSCTGPHLHFETRVGGTAYDPRSYLG